MALKAVLLIGSLAFVLGSSNNLGVPVATLNGVFPAVSIPKNPNDSSDKSPRETTGANPVSNTNNGVNPKTIQQLRILTEQQKPGQIYKYEFPLEEESQGPYGKEQEVELQGETQTYHRRIQDDENNGKENTQVEIPFDTIKPHKKSKKASKREFSSIQDFQNENKNQKNKVRVGNGTQIIEGAGTGYHPDIAVAAHPQGHYDHGQVHHHEVVEPHHLVVDHQGHQDVHGYDEHVVVEPGHHVPLPHAKPLKASVVHRDPHDTFDHYDKIRTLDKDHHHHDHQGHNVHQVHGVHGYEDVKNEFTPYHYDMHKIPDCAHKNKHFYNLTFCLEDHLYPLDTILWAIHQSGPYVHQLLTDVTYQSADNLVTGLTRAEEEGYTYKHYFGAQHSQHTNLEQYKPPYRGYSYSADYFKKGGYICPSDIYYGRPRRAMNTFGKWKVIVNVDHIPKRHHDLKKRGAVYEYGHKGHGIHQKPYTQTLRLEQCIYPNAPCSYIDSHFHSSCIQKHNFVRLVAWTHDEGLHVDTFKMPIACSCHIRQPIHFYHESSNHIVKEGHFVPPLTGNNYEHGSLIAKRSN